MRRSLRLSSRCVVLGWTTHVPGVGPLAQACWKGAVLIETGPAKAEAAGLVQSVRKRQRFSRLLPRFITKFGEPAEGALAPSMSEGTSPPCPGTSKQTMRAGLPLSIFSRSYAQTLEPRN